MPFITSDAPAITASSQIGIETVSGTPVAATKIYQGLSFNVQPDGQADMLKPEGSKLAVLAIPNTEWSASDLVLLPDYNAINIPLSGIVLPVSTVDGAATKRVYSPSTRKVDGYNTFTFEKGDNIRARRSSGNTVVEFGFDASRKAIAFNGKTMAHSIQDNVGMSVQEVQTVTITGNPTGGTFNLSFGGQTATAIPYNVTASALQTLLNAAWTNNKVTVSGGPLPGTGMVIKFLASGNQVPITSTGNAFTGGTTPAVAIAETIPGTTPTEVPAVGISPKTFDLFIDTTAAGLGVTQMDRAFALSFKLTGLRDALWAMKSSNSDYAAMIDAEPSVTFSLTLGYDDAGMDIHAAFQSGASRFLRFRSLGAAIPGSASNYLFQLDACVKMDKPVNITNQDGLVIATSYTGQITHDATWGKGYELTDTSTVATL